VVNRTHDDRAFAGGTSRRGRLSGNEGYGQAKGH